MPDYHRLHCYEHIKLMLTEGCSNTNMRYGLHVQRMLGPLSPLLSGYRTSLPRACCQCMKLNTP